MIIRAERADDYFAIRHVNEAAFGGPDEARLVEALRADGAVLVSLVADVDGLTAGHILFSRMSIETPGQTVEAVALAPLAVLPASQRQGIGGNLIRHGLQALRGTGERIVIVVGHAAYYPRFGFSTEKARPLESPFDSEAFMALELSPGALDGVQGRVRYARAFGL